ncbi:MAG: hypothetical protein AVDCRST_MAG90-2653, partial [uncultured Microvirga sp.]
MWVDSGAPPSHARPMKKLLLAGLALLAAPLAAQGRAPFTIVE